MASITTQADIKKIIGLYKSGDKYKPQEIANIVGVSKRTVERKIKDYEAGKYPFCDNVVKGVSQFEKEEDIEILDIIKSNSYSKIVNMGLRSLTQERIDEELDNKGIRGVVGMIGTLIDKRLKSYAIELEKENLELKTKIASNSRSVVFMNEGEIYASSNELPNRHTKGIS